MVNWENGTETGEYINSGMFVEINGIRYPVMMPEMEGNTPLTADKLNENQENLLEFEVDDEW